MCDGSGAPVPCVTSPSSRDCTRLSAVCTAATAYGDHCGSQRGDAAGEGAPMGTAIASFVLTAGYDRPRVLRRHRALVAALVGAILVFGLADSGILGLPAAPGHQPTVAPAQAWGSASGQAHVVGQPADLPIPPTVRSLYPNLPVVPAPTPTPNAAWASAPDT